MSRNKQLLDSWKAKLTAQPSSESQQVNDISASSSSKDGPNTEADEYEAIESRITNLLNNVTKDISKQ